MKMTLKRAAVAVAAASTLGAGAIMGAAPAHAATPGDLQIIGGVDCVFKAWGPNWNSGPVWQMRRWMGVKNMSDTFSMNNVTVTEFGGATKRVPANLNKKKNAAGQLKPGQVYIAFDTTWKGCWPSSISGYTIGQEVENPFNNVGFWQNVRNAQPKDPS